MPVAGAAGSALRGGAVRAGNGALCRRCAHTSPTAPPRWESLTQMEPLIELCRRRGFVYPCSDIYGGMANTYDYGPLGAQLRQNLRRLWWRDMVLRRADTVGLESSVIMHPSVWRAAGHVENFSDPMVDCRECKTRIRADHLPAGASCPACGASASALTEPRDFNLLFRTHVGPTDGAGTEAYLRPETAQGIFVHFANIMASARRPRLPLGVAQIGKAFRNEISPGQFLFRTREFEQMELEYFVNPAESEDSYRYWVAEAHTWLRQTVGLSEDRLRLEEHQPSDLAHYALATTDIEFSFPFGWGELWGVANRGCYDLQRHAEASGATSLSVDGIGARPHPALPRCPPLSNGALSNGLTGDSMCECRGGWRKGHAPRDRALRRAGPADAGGACGRPRRGAQRRGRPGAGGAAAGGRRRPGARGGPPSQVEPPGAERDRGAAAREPRGNPPTRATTAATRAEARRLRQGTTEQLIEMDRPGSIGKRYRRQDEIGTPYCITVDFDSLGAGPEGGSGPTVTVRERDSMEQRTVPIDEVAAAIGR